MSFRDALEFCGFMALFIAAIGVGMGLFILAVALAVAAAVHIAGLH